MNFTAGEWVLRGDKIGIVDDSDTQSFGMMLTIAYIDQYDFPEYKENAKLMAAAPKLFKALEDMLEQFNENTPGLVTDELSAIAQARKVLREINLD